MSRVWARRAERAFSEPVRVSEFHRDSPGFFSEMLRESEPREVAETVPGVGTARGTRLCRLQQEGAARRVLLQRGLPATAGPPRPWHSGAATPTGFSLAWSLTEGYRIFNTWMGDMTKLLLFRAVLEAAEREGLQARAVSTGAALMRTLEAARERRPRCWGSTLPPRPPAARRLNPPVFARGCECTAASCSFTPPSWHPHAEPAPPALRWLSSQPHLSRDAVHSHAVGAAPSRGAQLARRRHHHRL